MYVLVTEQDGAEMLRTAIDGAELPEDAVRFGLESEPVQTALLMCSGAFVAKIENAEGIVIARLEVNSEGIYEEPVLSE